MKALLIRSLLVLVSLFLAVQLWVFACLLWWQHFPVHHSMFMRAYSWSSEGKPLDQQWVDDANISIHVKRALIAGEDAKFIYHHGFDWDGIRAALQKNDKKGHVVAGGSTISQQLAKNLFLTNQRSYIRKGEEAIITWMMERMWSKQRILEVYLNVIEFGRGIYGIEAAAQYYYGKSASQINAAEAAKLAGLVPNPVYYQVNPKDRKMLRRVGLIRRYMEYSRTPE
ncbi:monofunctional biosynthetic peptidoglycan transglycosylase [Aquirhabdus parva]|uniref:Biosynthetic peptidoglycan transglycosylase n=1 Tax=Aquirhabdus parva TaxID=2283318 RepID=A0A345P649_9GAMM|nr:monofunctional biosynthetic peptidoglycan transglycosylase [Aquirhabdus parva]AXI02758.1 monofunctional biosynthetic peptidoglycan transglycosylase [Aquirhabdus parva]